VREYGTDNMGYEQCMEAAVASLKAQKIHNFNATAKKFKLGHTAVSRRFKGQTMSQAETNSKYLQLLTNV
jgi:hypothetical protein